MDKPVRRGSTVKNERCRWNDLLFPANLLTEFERRTSGGTNPPSLAPYGLHFLSLWKTNQRRKRKTDSSAKFQQMFYRSRMNPLVNCLLSEPDTGRISCRCFLSSAGWIDLICSWKSDSFLPKTSHQTSVLTCLCAPVLKQLEIGFNRELLFSFFCGLNRSSEEEFLSLRKDFRRNRNPLADEPFFPRILFGFSSSK